MRRAAAKGDPSAAGQAAAAADRLREAQRQLERKQQARGERDVKDAQRQAEEIAREQQEIARTSVSLPQAGPRSPAKAQMLGQRKDALEAKVASLEKQLDRMAGETTRDSKDTRASCRRPPAASATTRSRRRSATRRACSARVRRKQIRAQLRGRDRRQHRSLRKKLNDAASSVGQRRPRPSAERSTRRASSRAAWIHSASACRSARASDGRRPGSRRPEARKANRVKKASKARKASRVKGQSGKESQVRPGQQGQSDSRARTTGQSGQRANAGQAGQPGQAASAARTRQRHGRRDGNGDPPFPRWRLGPRRSPPGPTGSRPTIFASSAVRFAVGRNETAELRNMLREQNLDAKDLDEILRRLRELDADRVYQDAAELERLQTFVSRGPEALRYGLRRKAGDEADRALVNGTDEVPEEFRSLVEEYYRSLSKPEK